MARCELDAMNASGVCAYHIVRDASASDTSSIVSAFVRKIAYAPSGEPVPGTDHVSLESSRAPRQTDVPSTMTEGLGLRIPRMHPSRCDTWSGLGVMLSGSISLAALRTDFATSATAPGHAGIRESLWPCNHVLVSTVFSLALGRTRFRPNASTMAERSVRRSSPIRHRPQK